MSVEELIECKTPPRDEEWPIDYEDFRRFFWKHKGLLKEAERNDAFWNATNENLQKAYGRLDDQERELARAYGLNLEYLDNIQEGLLMIDQDGTILDQYSAYLTGLFHTTDIAHRKLVDLVYQDKESLAEERQIFSRFLAVLFTNRAASDNVLDVLNPLSDAALTVCDADGALHEIKVSVRFNRIFEDDDVTRVIFTIEDRTEIVRIQQELVEQQDRHTSETESISAILRAGPQAFVDFVRESNHLIADLEERLSRPVDPPTVDLLMREFHTLKGSAKYLELDYLSSLAHQAEHRLSALRVAPTPDHIDALRADATRLKDQLSTTLELADRIRQFSKVGSLTTDDRTAVPVFLESLKRMTERIGAELGKSLEVRIISDVAQLSSLDKVKVALIHLVRNAVDHGIEDELDRVAVGKKTTGKVTIRFAKGDGECVIQVTDDGCGVDFGRVEQRARDLGLIKAGEKADQKKLMSLLFSASFSSRESATDISGRGFGLDVVRDTVSHLGGRISVTTRKRQGTRFILRIPDTPITEEAE